MTSKINKLNKQLEKERQIYKKKFNEIFGKTTDFEEFEKYMKPYTDKLSELDLEIRLIQKPKFKNIPNYGNHMTMNDFIEMCEDGSLTDYDGCGDYATAFAVSDILIYPSDVRKNKIRNDFSHVIWFNK